MISLEENIEFVDWSKIPQDQITNDIKRKFRSSFDLLRFRLLLDRLFSCMVVKTDEEKYPGWNFFFNVGDCYICFYESEGKFYITKHLTSKIESENFQFSNEGNQWKDIYIFLKNVLEKYMQKEIVIKESGTVYDLSGVEQYFYEIFPPKQYLSISQYFKDK